MRQNFNLSISKFFIVFFVLVTSISCSKGGGGGSTPVTPAEADLAITLNPVTGSNLAPAALTSGLPLVVTITSTIPSGGVKIDVTAKLETGSTNFFTGGTASTSILVNNYTITSIPTGGAACVCNVTVTSLSKSSNVWTGSFRFANK